MLRTFLFVLLCATVGIARAAPTILVFGDSISAGYGLPQGTGWVDLLRERLKAEHYDYKVANASLSGETTTGGKNRLPAALAKHKPQIVILELGANDALRGARAADISANLSAMIAEVRKYQSSVLLLGMRVPPNYGSEYEQKFRSVYEDIAKSKRVALAPFLFEGFAENRAMFQPDGIHPTAAAQRPMLDTVWPHLQPLLVRPAVTTR